VIAVLVSAAAALTEPLWAAQLGFSDSSGVVLLAVAWTAPAAALQLLLAVLLSQDRLGAFTTVNVLAGVGGQAIGLTILATAHARTAEAYAWGNLTSLLITATLGIVLVRPTWSGVRDHPATRSALTIGLPLMVSGLAIFVLNASDRLVVQRLLGSAEAGRYQIAYTIGNIAVIVLTMTSGAWAPRISAVRDELARWALIGQARDGLVRLMSPVLLGVTLGAPVALQVVAPASFRPEELLVVVFLVALSGFPVVVGTGSGRALVTLDRTRLLAASAIVAALANVALNLVLIPAWGLAGAAAATTIAFGVQTVLHRFALPRGIAWPRTDRRVLATALAVVAVSAASVELPQTSGWNALRFAVAVACLPWFLHQLLAARAGERATEQEDAGTDGAPATGVAADVEG
jgi:O-antigen/teichoic acid export membrane protein